MKKQPQIVKPIEKNQKKGAKKNFLILCPLLIIFCIGVLAYITFFLSKEETGIDIAQVKGEEPQPIIEEKEAVFDKVTQDELIDQKVVDGAMVSVAVERERVKGLRWKVRGVLWIDRENHKCFVNRGTSDGVHAGAFVDIYQRRRQIGTAKIMEVFDKVSYAQLIGKDEDEFIDNSYEVVIRY